MLPQLKASYQRLEQSLQRLTDSISAYNPSVSAADDLVAADAAVSQDLETLHAHQSNFARIRTLRQTSASLDAQIRENLQTLADIRRDILTVPAFEEDDKTPAVPVEDVLSYAKFISRTSVPPASAPAMREKPASEDVADINGSAAEIKKEETNPAYVKAENVGLQAIDEQTKRNLDPTADLPFEPWPSYAVMQQGLLADIQRMVDAGKDPASVLSAEDQIKLDQLKKEQEENERIEEEQRNMRRMSTFPNSSSTRAAAPQSDVFDPDA